MPSLLVLGGTAWVGREVSAQALARGWEVTCLARGESGIVAPGAELVIADRDEAGCYAEVAEREWDAVVEVSWQPRQVREAAQALEAVHWVYVSSVAAYAPTRSLIGEDAPLREPVAADARVTGEDYDAAKVRCELDTLAAHPDALLLRAGVIVGPGDPTERFAYWPRRARQAGAEPMLIPDAPVHPFQLIDVRDLAAYVIDAIEAGVTGPVNAVGDQRDGGDLIELIREVAGAHGPLVRAPAEWLLAHGVRPWKGRDSMPLWYPDDGTPARIGYHSDARYLATGGTRRPLIETVRDVMLEEIDLGLDRPGLAGLSRERELALLAEREAQASREA